MKTLARLGARKNAGMRVEVRVAARLARISPRYDQW